MKKSVCLLLTSALVFALVGCGSTPAAAARTANLPSFVLNPPSTEDAVYGVGSSNTSKQSRALDQANARARTDLAMKLKAQVKAMIIDYTREAGTDDNTVGLNFYESISQQLTEATLVGVETVKTEATDDGSIWVLVRMLKADAAKAASGVIENEASQYAEFKAMQALDMMNAQLNKADPKDLQPSAPAN